LYIPKTIVVYYKTIYNLLLMGYLELDHSPEIARMKLGNEIDGVWRAVQTRVTDLHRFATEHPESGYKVETTPTEGRRSPLIQVFDPQGNEVARLRDGSFMSLYGSPTESGSRDELAVDSYGVTLSHGLPDVAVPSFMTQRMDLVPGTDRIGLDRQFTYVRTAQARLRGMARAPKAPAPATATKS
jgi:hypothetical protein